MMIVLTTVLISVQNKIIFFKQKTAYEMRISDWSSDMCSSDLGSCAVVAGSLDMGRRAPPPADTRLSAPGAAHVVRPVGECGNDRNHHAHAGSPVGMTRSPRGNVDRRCECCRCVKCPRLAGLRLFSRTLSGINRWLNRAMIDQTD